MLQRLNILGSLLVALSPALIAAGTPIQSQSDLEKICYYSPPRHSPYRTQEAWPSAASQDGFVQVASAMHAFKSPSHNSPQDEATPEPSDLLQTAMAAKRYTVERGAVLMREYNVRLDPTAFRIHPYDKETGNLTVDFAAQSTFLERQGNIKWAMPTSLEFEVNENEAATIIALADAGDLVMDALVQIASREAPESEFCETSDEAEPTLSLVLISATFRDKTDGHVIAQAVTRQYDRAACVKPSGHGQVPHIDVTDLASTGNGSLTLIESVTLQLLAETELHFCYMDALQENAATQGALVVELSLDPNGRLSNSGVSIDALNNHALISCTIRALDNAAIPRPDNASALSIRMNLTFSKR